MTDNTIDTTTDNTIDTTTDTMIDTTTNDETNNFLSEVTLAYLMNKDQYAKYMVQNTSKSKQLNKKDKKFYRKRIFEITKQLLNNEPSDHIFPDIVHGFDSYVKMCIHYFKMLDRRDILQEEHDAHTMDKNNSTPVQTQQSGQNEIQNEANKLIMRTFHIKEPNSLEKLVKRRITRVGEKPPIIPIQKEINLKDPVLKNKGIRKKNNINNKYEIPSKDDTSK
jgi:hypothetical protein